VFNDFDGAAQSMQVRPASRGEVVEDADVVTILEKAPRKRGADEPSAACHEDPFDGAAA